MSHLPERGAVLGLLVDDPTAPAGMREAREVGILAYDEECAVWTAQDTATGELVLLTFDENDNWFYLTSTFEDDATAEQ